MSESMEERLAQAMADLERTRHAVTEAEERMRSASTTVTSKDRAVEVTVGPQGELTQIRFLDGKYRNMGSGQLSSAILEAVQRGRAQMAQQVLAAFRPLSEQAGGDLPRVEGSGIEWDKIFGHLSATAASGSAQGPTNSRLRDEIHEDAEESDSPGSARAESRPREGK